MDSSADRWVTKEEFRRAIYGANGSIGIAESLRNINAWILAFEVRRTKETANQEWWQRDIIKTLFGAVLALAGVGAEHLLFR